MSEYLSFRLADSFVQQYESQTPPWGFSIGAGNTLGELTFLSKYSRRLPDGRKETWVDACRRVIEGTFSILKDHCAKNRTPWNELKAQSSAQDAFERMFNMKWLPPGRGIWMMGTEFTNGKQNSAALQNCGFLSTEKLSSHSHRQATLPFARMMEMSMLGIGVGFDTKGADKLTIHEPDEDRLETRTVEDSREGWYQSTADLLISYFFGGPAVVFDYKDIRPAGEPIVGFGGVAAGADPLIRLHGQIRTLFNGRSGEKVSSSDIVDVMNLCGKCVVSGNVRRSAQIAIGDADDKAFLDLKNWEVNPERNDKDGWGHVSNNSVFAEVGGNYDHLVPRMASNGEPGLLYLDLCREYGRLIDPANNKDRRVSGTNPCGEQSLEDMELCVAGETLLHTSDGLIHIKEVQGQVEIWNGDHWSAVTPFSTGVNPLYRVAFSDGSYLDATPGHEWITRVPTERTFKVRKTSDLRVGMVLPEFELANCGGKSIEFAYEWGWFAGDGYLDAGRPRAVIQEAEYGLLESLNVASVYPEQIAKQVRPFRRVSLVGIVPADVALVLRDKRTGLPDEVLQMDVASIGEFIAGWIDSDGSVIRQERTDHLLLYGTESKLRDAQVLLRRIGVNHSTLRRFASAGDVTNKGVRTVDLWRLLIPSYESMLVPTRVKIALRFGVRHGANNAHVDSVIDRARKQKIVAIEYLDEAETFCFNEPVNHMGVFGNVLTKQCTLVETFPVNHESLEDYLRTLKVAYLYGKAVTLLPTHWPETNEVMQRNRRIGCSVSGSAQFAERSGWTELRTWLNRGYEEIQRRDRQYSEWLGVRESIKTTSVKPSGTVSLLAGVTPGVHWPTADVYIRRMRLSKNDPLIVVLEEAGYATEPDFSNPDFDVVVELPTRGPDVRTEQEVSVWEKAALAVLHQRYWADNQVSVTLTFRPEEADQVSSIVRAFDGQLKSLTFLPVAEAGAYRQMPYERIDDETFVSTTSNVRYLNWAALYAGASLDAEGESFCTNDVCEIPR